MQDPTLMRIGSALSGLLMVLFLVVHLAGLLPALIAPAQFELYATALHHQPWLPILEVSLATTAAVHLIFTAAKTLRNRRAGNTAALRSRRGRPIEALASRSKVAAGVITLGFLALHLQQLRWPRPVDGLEREVLLKVLQQPTSLLVYGLSSLAIGLHLLHGAEAAHRNLGFLNPVNGPSIRWGGRLLATVIGGGFLLISLELGLGGLT
jgi:succinate dehydrogenase / fumarate reductase cytochrome b subunit